MLLMLLVSFSLFGHKVLTQAPSSAYLVCVQYSTYTNVVERSVTCELACVTTDHVCGCINNITWSINTNFVDTGLTCANLACDQNLVVENALTSITACPDPKNSKVFDILSWFDGENINNFIYISPNLHIPMFTEITVSLFFPETAANKFTFNFGDGYSIKHSSHNSSHIYTNAGEYTIKVSVDSHVDFDIEQTVSVYIPLQNAEFVDFISGSSDSSNNQVVYLENQTSPSQFIGFVVGSGLIQVEMDFDEEQDYVNSTSPTGIQQDNRPCFYICTGFMVHNNLGQATGAGVFIMTNYKLKYGGLIHAVEFYAATSSLIKILVVRQLPSGGYDIISSSEEISHQIGYQLLNLDKSLSFDDEDLIALELEDGSTIIEIIDNFDSQISYYDDPNDLSSSVLTFTGKTYRFQVIAVSPTYFYLEHIFNLTGDHLISFTATDVHGSTIEMTEPASKKNHVHVKSNYPVFVRFDMDSTIAATKPFQFCVVLSQNHDTEVTFLIDADNYDGDVQVLYNNTYRSVKGISTVLKNKYLTITTNDSNPLVENNVCMKFIISLPGLYEIGFVAKENDQQFASEIHSLDVIKPFTNLHLNYTSDDDPIKQLSTVVTFEASYESLTTIPFIMYYDFDDDSQSSITYVSPPNLKVTHIFAESRNYTVRFIVKYGSLSDSVAVNIEVPSIFYIQLSDEQFYMQDEIIILKSDEVSYQPEWTLDCLVVPPGVLLSAVGKSSAGQVSYFTVGIFNIGCDLSTPYGSVIRNHTTKVYQPIDLLEINVNKTSQLHVGANVSFYATVSLGNYLEYTWDVGNPAMTVVEAYDNEVKIHSPVAGFQLIKVTAKNTFFEKSTEKYFQFTDNNLESFSVEPEQMHIKVNETVDFMIRAIGGKNKDFIISNSDLGLMQLVKETVFSYTFATPGFFPIQFALRLADQTRNCNGEVSCVVKSNITVLKPINHINIYHDSVEIGTVLYVESGVDVLLRFVVKNMNVFNFQLTINDVAMREIPGNFTSPDSSAETIIPKLLLTDIRSYKFVLVANNPISSFTHKFHIQTVQSISGLTIDSQPYAGLNVPHKISAKHESGTNIIYKWKVNGANVSSSKDIYYSFASMGRYDVVLEASNWVSQNSTSKRISVINPVTGLFVTCGEEYILVDSYMNVVYGITGGDDVTLTLYDTMNYYFDQRFVSCSQSCAWSDYMYLPEIGRKEITVEARNPAISLITETCIVNIQKGIKGALLTIPSTGYVSEVITFTVQQFGGNQVKGVVEIIGHNDSIASSYSLLFQPCLFLKDCGVAQVNHYFEVSNRYTIRCYVFNEVSRYNCTSEDIFILPVVENKDFEINDFLQLVAEAVSLGEISKIHIIKHPNFYVKSCKVDLDVSGLDPLPVNIDINQTVVYTYDRVGSYNVKISCFSPKGTVDATTKAAVQKPLQLVDIQTSVVSNDPLKCVQPNENVTIDVELMHEEMVLGVITKVWVNDYLLTPVIDMKGKALQYIIPLHQTDQLSSKYVTFRISNAISYVEKEFSFCVVRPVKSIKCHIPSVWEFGDVVPFQVNVESESDVNLQISFGDGNNLNDSIRLKLNQDDLTLTELSHSHTHSYMTAGVFFVEYIAENVFKPAKRCEGVIEMVETFKNVTLVYQDIIHWPDNKMDFYLKFGNNISSLVEIEFQFRSGETQHTTPFKVLNQNSSIDRNVQIPLLQHTYSLPGCYQFSFIVRSKINIVALKGVVTILDLKSFTPSIQSLLPDSNSQANLFRNDFPLNIVIHDEVAVCFEYIWNITEFVNTTKYSGTSSKETFEINELIGKQGRFNMTLSVVLTTDKVLLDDAVAGNHHYHRYLLPSIIFELYTTIPELYLEVYSKPQNQTVQTLLLMKSKPPGINQLTFDFGDGNVLNVPPVFTLQNIVDLPFITSIDLPGNTPVYVLDFSYTYAKEGTYMIKINASNIHSQSDIEKSVLIDEIHCERPTIKILTNSELAILEFFYHHHISIFSSINITCGSNYEVSYQWSVYKSSAWEVKNGITSTGKTPESLTTVNESPTFQLKKKTLSSGYYILKLQATLLKKNLENSKEVTVRIIEEPILAIIQGGSLQQLSWQNAFVLDASQSSKLNEHIKDLQFEWYCRYLKNNIQQNCFYDDINAIGYVGSKWPIKERVLLSDVAYEFTVVISSTEISSSKGVATKTLMLIDDEIPLIGIRCLTNCWKFVNPTARLTLTLDCENCAEINTLAYDWKYIAGSNYGNFTFGIDTLTKDSLQSLVVKGGVLEAGSQHTFAVNVTKSSGVSSYVEYTFTTNSRPHDGSCNISPNSGVAVQTTYTVSCSNWKSSGSLTYSISRETVDKNGDLSVQLLSYGPLETVSFFLSSGEFENDYMVNITVDVIDIYDTKASVYLTTTVLPITKTSQVDLWKQTVGQDASLEKLSAKGDSQSLMQLSVSVVGALNVLVDEDVTDDDDNDEDKEDMKNLRIEIRKEIAATVSKVNVKSIQDVKQSADVIAPLLDVPEEVTQETQDYALKSFTDMTSYLTNDEELADDDNPDNKVEVVENLVRATGNLLHVIRYQSKQRNSTELGEKEVQEGAKKTQEKTSDVFKVVDQLVPLILQGKVSGENPTKITGKTIALEISRHRPDEVGNQTIDTLQGGSFHVPKKLYESRFGKQDVIDSKVSNDPQEKGMFQDVNVKVQMVSLPGDPFLTADDGSSIDSFVPTISSPVTSLSFTHNGESLPVENLQTEQEVEFHMPQNAPINTISFNTSSLNDSTLLVYQFTLKKDQGSILLFINTTTNLRNEPFRLESYVALNKRPTITQYDDFMLYDGNDDRFLMMSSNDDITVFYVGFRLPDKYEAEGDIDVSFFTTGCYFWNEKTKQWKTRGCRVGRSTTRYSTHCICDHLTWFGSNFFVPPNELDIKKELLKLKNIDNYPALLATFCVLSGLYLIFLVLTIRQDRKERNCDKGEPTFLRSQSSPSGTTYHLTFYTGHRSGSGTTATPIIIISGLKSDTRPLILKVNRRSAFDTASVETFMFCTNVDINNILYVTIWHDDKGKDPSWFLSRLVVTNLDTQKQYVFFCNDWFALDQSDGCIMRTLPVASLKEMQSFENIFLAKTARDITDGHLWYSILTKPPRSNFTRAQRVSSVFCLLVTTMLTNAMFYRVAENAPVGDEIDISGFKISWTEVLIGIESSLIVIPINYFIVTLFRRAKPIRLHETETRRKLEEEEQNSEEEFNSEELLNVIVPFQKLIELPSKPNVLFDKEFLDVSLTGVVPDKGSSFVPKNSSIHEDLERGIDLNQIDSIDFDDTFCFQQTHPYLLTKSSQNSKNSSIMKNVHSTTLNQNQNNLQPKEVSRNPFEATSTAVQTDKILSRMSVHIHDELDHWPHWVKYIAWLLFVLVTLTTGFFTLLYGLSFGKSGQEKWLLSLFVSVFLDITVYQPVKVVCFAALITIVVRKLKDEYVLTEIENFRDVNWQENEDSALDTTAPSVNVAVARPPKPTKSYIEMARKTRLYEAKLVDVILEIISFLFYLFLCLLITYGHRDPDAYQMTNNVENIFINGKFDQVSSIPDFWIWSFDSLSPGLYKKFTLDGKTIEENSFISDGATILVGLPRFRQKRAKPEACVANGKYGFHSLKCGIQYNSDFEDRTSQYCTSWKPCSGNNLPLYPKLWKYTRTQDSQGETSFGRIHTYTSSGYNAVLGKTKPETDRLLNYLFDNKWLDKYTRAVFVEFTLYNTQHNFYVMVLMALEIPATGGAFTYKNIVTTRLDRYNASFATFVAVCEITFLLFTIFYMIREFKRLRILRFKYFADWRNWVEVIGFICIWMSFILLMIRMLIVAQVKSWYNKDREAFVNFDSASSSDQVYGFSLSIVAFLVLLKFLKLLRFNVKIGMMIRTIIYASEDLKHFSFAFCLAFISYCLFAKLIFGNHIEKYASFLSTIASMVNLLLGHFDFEEFESTSRFWGPFLFITFVMLMVFIFLNMFISILNDAYAFMELKMRKKKNKYEIIDFLIHRITNLLPARFTRKQRKLISNNPEMERFQNQLVASLKTKKIVKKEKIVREVGYNVRDKYKKNVEEKPGIEGENVIEVIDGNNEMGNIISQLPEKVEQGAPCSTVSGGCDPLKCQSLLNQPIQLAKNLLAQPVATTVKPISLNNQVNTSIENIQNSWYPGSVETNSTKINSPHNILDKYVDLETNNNTKSVKFKKKRKKRAKNQHSGEFLVLEHAINRLDSYSDFMINEDEFDNKMLTRILQLVNVKNTQEKT